MTREELKKRINEDFVSLVAFGLMSSCDPNEFFRKLGITHLSDVNAQSQFIAFVVGILKQKKQVEEFALKNLEEPDIIFKVMQELAKECRSPVAYGFITTMACRFCGAGLDKIGRPLHEKDCLIQKAKKFLEEQEKCCGNCDNFDFVSPDGWGQCEFSNCETMHITAEADGWIDENDLLLHSTSLCLLVRNNHYCRLGWRERTV